MSWLKLTAGHLYLMKGGSDQYIDRVKIENRLPAEGKPGDIQTGVIKEFPHEWFESTIQRPRTIIFNSKEEPDGNSNIEPFTKVQILKRFEVPVSYDFFETLSTSKKISELIKKFEEIVGTRFSDEFFLYEIIKVQKLQDGKPVFTPDNKPVIDHLLDNFFTYSVDDTIRKDKERWNVTSRVKYAKDFPIDGFPPNPINSRDPDSDEEEPSFMSKIFIDVLWNSGLTVKPYLVNDPASESKIIAELLIMESDFPHSRAKVSVETLEMALIPQVFVREEANKIVKDVLKQLSKDRKITVNTTDFLAGKPCQLDFSNQLTFTDVMDTIAVANEAIWDWDGRNRAFLKKNNSSQ